jgi:hypothetical protein
MVSIRKTHPIYTTCKAVKIMVYGPTFTNGVEDSETLATLVTEFNF